MSTMQRHTRGFSLIELMVVMAIIAALVTIALPRYQGSVENARIVTLKSNLRLIRESLDRYHEDRGHAPETLDALVEAGYLKALPVDPLTETATSWQPVDDAEAGGVVDVRSGARGASRLGVVYAEL